MQLIDDSRKQAILINILRTLAVCLELYLNLFVFKDEESVFRER